MLGITYLAEIISSLTWVSVTGQIWALPFLIYLNAVDTGGISRWVMYALITLLLGYPSGEFCVKDDLRCWRGNANTLPLPAHPIQVGWNSRNSNTVRSRTVSAACYNMFVQASATIASNIYRKGKQAMDDTSDVILHQLP